VPVTQHHPQSQPLLTLMLQIATVCSMMGYRLVDRAFVWANRPHDDMLLAESEKQVQH
jgi:hypothetical protein